MRENGSYNNEAKSEGIHCLQVLIMGQAVLSRTETLEEYFRERCSLLAVIALAGIRQAFGGRSTVYTKGMEKSAFGLHSFCVRGSLLPHRLLYGLHYFTQFFSTIYAALRIRERFDLAIGIGTFYTCMSLLLRRLGLVDHVVYYSIDYYPAKNFLNKIFIRMDSICFRNADVVWNLSSPIMNARHSNLGIVRASKETIVPLSYPAKVLTIRAMSDIERWSISYAGVIDELHGLQLLFEALPEVLEHLPNVILRIVGLGPYSDHLKLLTKKLGLEQHVIFHGFLQQPDMLDLLSRCAIGIAPFVPVPENNATYSDSGKPKLYAFCGLPVIITKVYSGFLVASNKAGILVDYNVRELAKAIVSLLNDEQRLNQFRQKARDYALSCTSERVYGDALKSTSAAIGSFKRVRSRI